MAADREAMRGSGERGGETRPGRQIYVPKMGEADDPEVFLETFRGVAEVSKWPPQEWAHRLLPLLMGWGPARGPQPTSGSPEGLRHHRQGYPGPVGPKPGGTSPPVPGPGLHRRRPALHLRPAAAGPGEEVAGPGTKHTGGRFSNWGSTWGGGRSGRRSVRPQVGKAAGR